MNEYITPPKVADVIIRIIASATFGGVMYSFIPVCLFVAKS